MNKLKDKTIYLENILKNNNDFLKSIAQTFYEDAKEVKLIKCIPHQEKNIEYIKINLLIDNIDSIIKIKL